MSIVAVERDAAGLPVRLAMGTRQPTEREIWMFRYYSWCWLLLGPAGRARLGSRLTESQQRALDPCEDGQVEMFR